MPKPPLEVADLVRSAGRNFIEQNRRWLNRLHVKVLTAIERCRTAALGGHLDACGRCGHRVISFNSCRDRHCPKCQANARDRWLRARERELLPTRYAHVVFTLPHELGPLTLQNKKIVYDLLFHVSAQTLMEIARDPQHLGAEIGFFSVLHTWNQKLEFHPHIHCVVPAGGLSADHSRWVTSQKNFFLPVEVLSEVFKGKFTEALRETFADGRLGFHGSLQPLGRPKVFAQLLRQIYRKKWVVYAKRPFGGAQHALRYLGCYTHRVAISNHRLTEFKDDRVTFRWRDSAHNNKKRLMTLHVNDFLRRFLLHVLPSGFVRIRHFGFLSTRNRSKLLPICFGVLQATNDSAAAINTPAIVVSADHSEHSNVVWRCPHCQGEMLILARLTAFDLRYRGPPALNTTAA